MYCASGVSEDFSDTAAPSSAGSIPQPARTLSAQPAAAGERPIRPVVGARFVCATPRLGSGRSEKRLMPHSPALNGPLGPLVVFDGNINASILDAKEAIRALRYTTVNQYTQLKDLSSNPYAEAYKKAPSQYAFSKCVWALKSRYETYLRALQLIAEKKASGVVLHGSPWSDWISAENDVINGYLSKEAYSVYSKLRARMLDHLPLPQDIVYVDTRIEPSATADQPGQVPVNIWSRLIAHTRIQFFSTASWGRVAGVELSAVSPTMDMDKVKEFLTTSKALTEEIQSVEEEYPSNPWPHLFAKQPERSWNVTSNDISALEKGGALSGAVLDAAISMLRESVSTKQWVWLGRVKFPLEPDSAIAQLKDALTFVSLFTAVDDAHCMCIIVHRSPPKLLFIDPAPSPNSVNCQRLFYHLCAPILKKAWAWEANSVATEESYEIHPPRGGLVWPTTDSGVVCLAEIATILHLLPSLPDGSHQQIRRALSRALSLHRTSEAPVPRLPSSPKLPLSTWADFDMQLQDMGFRTKECTEFSDATNDSFLRVLLYFLRQTTTATFLPTLPSVVAAGLQPALRSYGKMTAHCIAVAQLLEACEVHVWVAASIAMMPIKFGSFQSRPYVLLLAHAEDTWRLVIDDETGEGIVLRSVAEKKEEQMEARALKKWIKEANVNDIEGTYNALRGLGINSVADWVARSKDVRVLARLKGGVVTKLSNSAQKLAATSDGDTLLSLLQNGPAVELASSPGLHNELPFTVYARIAAHRPPSPNPLGHDPERNLNPDPSKSWYSIAPGASWKVDVPLSSKVEIRPSQWIAGWIREVELGSLRLTAPLAPPTFDSAFAKYFSRRGVEENAFIFHLLKSKGYVAWRIVLGLPEFKSFPEDEIRKAATASSRVQIVDEHVRRGLRPPQDVVEFLEKTRAATISDEWMSLAEALCTGRLNRARVLLENQRVDLHYRAGAKGRTLFDTHVANEEVLSLLLQYAPFALGSELYEQFSSVVRILHDPARGHLRVHKFLDNFDSDPAVLQTLQISWRGQLAPPSLTTLLCNTKKLRVLILQGVSFLDGSIATALKANSSLEQLLLKDLHFESLAAAREFWNKALDGLKSCGNLKILSVADNKMVDDSLASELCNVIAAHVPILEFLSLRNCAITQRMGSTLIKITIQLPLLQVLLDPSGEEIARPDESQFCRVSSLAATHVMTQLLKELRKSTQHPDLLCEYDCSVDYQHQLEVLVRFLTVPFGPPNTDDVYLLRRLQGRMLAQVLECHRAEIENRTPAEVQKILLDGMDKLYASFSSSTSSEEMSQIKALISAAKLLQKMPTESWDPHVFFEVAPSFLAASEELLLEYTPESCCVLVPTRDAFVFLYDKDCRNDNDLIRLLAPYQLVVHQATVGKDSQSVGVVSFSPSKYSTVAALIPSHRRCDVYFSPFGDRCYFHPEIVALEFPKKECQQGFTAVSKWFPTSNDTYSALCKTNARSLRAALEVCISANLPAFAPARMQLDRMQPNLCTQSSPCYDPQDEYLKKNKAWEHARFCFAAAYHRVVCNGGTSGTNNNTPVELLLIDSAVDVEHPELMDMPILDHSKYDTDEDSLEHDDQHGTKVAAVIYAAHNTIGVRGLYPNLPCRHYEIRYRSEFFVWASERALDAVVARTRMSPNKKYVLNCSWTTGLSVKIRDCFGKIQHARHVITVIAGGNEGKVTDFAAQATKGNAIAVGALAPSSTTSWKRWQYSASGPPVRVYAPGAEIYLPHKTPDGVQCYVPQDGTSYAAPIVSAVCALAWKQNPDLAAGDIVRRITDKALDDDPNLHILPLWATIFGNATPPAPATAATPAAATPAAAAPAAAPAAAAPAAAPAPAVDRIPIAIPIIVPTPPAQEPAATTAPATGNQ